MAPRGAVVEPDVPDMGYAYNEKYQVWAENVVALYEEAVARHWSATRDIPWTSSCASSASIPGWSWSCGRRRSASSSARRLQPIHARGDQRLSAAICG